MKPPVQPAGPLRPASVPFVSQQLGSDRPKVPWVAAEAACARADPAPEIVQFEPAGSPKNDVRPGSVRGDHFPGEREDRLVHAFLYVRRLDLAEQGVQVRKDVQPVVREDKDRFRGSLVHTATLARRLQLSPGRDTLSTASGSRVELTNRRRPAGRCSLAIRPTGPAPLPPAHTPRTLSREHVLYNIKGGSLRSPPAARLRALASLASSPAATHAAARPWSRRDRARGQLDDADGRYDLAPPREPVKGHRCAAASGRPPAALDGTARAPLMGWVGGQAGACRAEVDQATQRPRRRRPVSVMLPSRFHRAEPRRSSRRRNRSFAGRS
jgi:hypothetical protein